MADNGIDFGQTSQAKFSLNSLVTPQLAGSNIAQDMAQAITVGGNLGNYMQQENEKADQARYFNANIAYQNMQSQQTKELNEAGADLNKRREVLDKYNIDYKSLGSLYELSDKYKASLGASVTSHIDTLENQYNVLYKHQKKNERIDNATYVISNAINVDPKEAQLTYNEMKSYLKTFDDGSPTELTDREIGDILSGAYINAKAVAMSDKSDITLDEARNTVKDVRTLLEGADPRIVGSALYKEGIKGFEGITEYARKKEEALFVDNLRLGDVPPKELDKAIKSYLDRGVITSKDQADYYSKLGKQVYIQKQAEDYNRQYTIANREISLTFNKAIYDGLSKEEATKVLFDLADKNGWDKRMVMDEVTKLNKIKDEEVLKQMQHNAANDLNRIKDSGSVVPPQELSKTIALAHSSTGVIPAEDLKLERLNKFQYEQKNVPMFMSFDDAVTQGKLLATDNTEYKAMADKKINGLSSSIFSDPTNLQNVNTAIKTTNQVGSIPMMFAQHLNSADPTTKEGLQQITNSINTMGALIANNPEKAEALLGGKAREYYLYKAASIQNEDGSYTITAPSALQVQTIRGNAMGRLPAQKSQDDVVFKDKYSGTADRVGEDKKIYDSLLDMGLGNRKAIDMINTKNGYLKGSNYELSGIDTSEPAYKTLVDSVKTFAESKGDFLGKPAYISVINNTLMIGTKDAPAQYSTGIPLKTVYTSDGKIAKDNNGMPLIGISELQSLYKRDKEVFDYESTMAAPIYKKGMQQFYYKAVKGIENAINESRTAQAEYRKEGQGESFDQFLKNINSYMYVDKTTLEYKLTH